MPRMSTPSATPPCGTAATRPRGPACGGPATIPKPPARSSSMTISPPASRKCMLAPSPPRTGHHHALSQAAGLSRSGWTRRGSGANPFPPPWRQGHHADRPGLYSEQGANPGSTLGLLRRSAAAASPLPGSSQVCGVVSCHNRIREPGVREVLAELKRLLCTQVDPEEVTRRAFAVQEKFLKGLSRNRSEDQLAKMFERRMGKGLARILASKVKEGEG